MNGFTYYTPTKVVFGRGTESQAGALIRNTAAAGRCCTTGAAARSGPAC